MSAKKVFLTGASAGIGRSTALRLLRDGHDVWGTSRDVRRLVGIEGLHPLELDLARNDSIDAAMVRGQEESSGFDVVINNAGNGIWSPVEALTPEQELAQFQVLVFGPMRIIRSCLPQMRERGAGVVINVTSLAADFPVPFLGTYSACKAAMVALSWSMQMELRGEPIRIVDLRPGDIRSDFHRVMPQVDVATSTYADNARHAFEAYDRGMQEAPPPEKVSNLLAGLVARNDQPSYQAIAVGRMLQVRVAPFLARFAPAGLLRWCTARYFKID